ncbi:MAG: glycosyltransferase [Magnetococcales bacterium]|nr:glycosyltransferase [Magnetococcales bacterium]HIJ85748.1 glycosyltransferase family 2 protein [Magnetococcales bacterium]
MKEKILVFITAYNCRSQISRVLSQFDEVTQGMFSEVLVIDNRSTDDTLDVAISSAKLLKHVKCTIQKNCENYGLGGSHKVGFNYAVNNNFDYCIILHGDDQGNIHDVIPFLKQGKHRQTDFLLGARFLPESRLVGYSKFRTFGNHVFNALYSLGIGRRIYDMGAGLNVFSVSSLKKFNYKFLADDLTFNMHLILSLQPLGVRYEYFPLTWREDDQVSNVKLFRVSKKTLSILMRFIVNKNSFVATDHSTRSGSDYPSDIVYQNDY